MQIPALKYRMEQILIQSIPKSWSDQMLNEATLSSIKIEKEKGEIITKANDENLEHLAINVNPNWVNFKEHCKENSIKSFKELKNAPKELQDMKADKKWYKKM